MSVHTKPHRKHAKLIQKFARFAAFNGLIDEGGEFAKTGRRAKKATTRHWTKREMQAGAFHKRSNAEPSACVTIKH